MTLRHFISLCFLPFLPTLPRVPVHCGRLHLWLRERTSASAVLLQPQSALQNASFPNNSSSPDVIHPIRLLAVSRTTNPVITLSPARRVSKYHHVRCRPEQRRRRRPTTPQATQRLDPLPLRQAPTAPPTRPRPAKADTGRDLQDHLCPVEDRVGPGPRHVR